MSPFEEGKVKGPIIVGHDENATSGLQNLPYGFKDRIWLRNVLEHHHSVDNVVNVFSKIQLLDSAVVDCEPFLCCSPYGANVDVDTLKPPAWTPILLQQLEMKNVAKPQVQYSRVV